MYKKLLIITSLAIICTINSDIHSDPTTPTYSQTFQDATTGDNEFTGSDGKRRWDVDANADQYQIESYERPTIQTYDNNEGSDPFSSQEYYQNLDIVEAKFGYDNMYLYGLIDMYGTDKSDQGGDTFEGMVYEYGFRLSLDADGRNGYLFTSDQPVSKNGTTYGTDGNSGFQDSDGDVGGRGIINGGDTGLDVTKNDNPKEEQGMNGYDEEIINDGKLKSNDAEVFFSRVNPLDNSIVEFALDYAAIGLSMSDLENILYLDFQAVKGGPKDPQNYFWNDKYNKLEAGSPYNLAEFGAENGVGALGNIYELDTVRGTVPVPEPGTYVLLSIVLIATAFAAYKRNCASNS